MLINKSAPQPAIMNTPNGGTNMVIMIRRICEIMLAVCRLGCSLNVGDEKMDVECRE
jgi:hypothetical protein